MILAYTIAGILLLGSIIGFTISKVWWSSKRDTLKEMIEVVPLSYWPHDTREWMLELLKQERSDLLLPRGGHQEDALKTLRDIVLDYNVQQYVVNRYRLINKVDYACEGKAIRIEHNVSWFKITLEGDVSFIEGVSCDSPCRYESFMDDLSRWIRNHPHFPIGI